MKSSPDSHASAILGHLLWGQDLSGAELAIGLVVHGNNLAVVNEPEVPSDASELWRQRGPREVDDPDDFASLGVECRLSEIRSVWYRQPSHFVLPAGMSGPERRHAAAEARCGLAGVLSSLDVLWVNYPARESDALKPRQLHVARRCGLTVPDSLVTNRPAGVHDFAQSIDGALAGKTLAAALLVESGRLQMAYTRRIEPGELDDLAGVETTAHLFQPFLVKKWECRVTVVGERVFAAAIHAGSAAAQVDWRADYDSLGYSVVEPPEPVITGILAFMKAFALSFGAFDFAVTPDEKWIMFECNPFGAYLWLEEALDLPITAALADLLTNGAAPC